MANQAFSGSEERLLHCVNAALQRKAKDLIILQVKTLSSFADYFMICSGTSDRQVKAIASWLQESLKQVGMIPLGIEGMQHGQWVLMDYGDIIVHIFYEPVRAFYDLEKFWSEAPKMIVNDDATEIKALDKRLTA